jgi:hypothetical protein
MRGGGQWSAQLYCTVLCVLCCCSDKRELPRDVEIQRPGLLFGRCNQSPGCRPQSNHTGDFAAFKLPNCVHRSLSRLTDLFGIAFRGLPYCSCGWRCLSCRASPIKIPAAPGQQPNLTNPSPHASLVAQPRAPPLHPFLLFSLLHLSIYVYIKFPSRLTAVSCILFPGIDLLNLFRFLTRLPPSPRRQNFPYLSRHIPTVVL